MPGARCKLCAWELGMPQSVGTSPPGPRSTPGRASASAQVPPPASTRSPRRKARTHAQTRGASFQMNPPWRPAGLIGDAQPRGRRPKRLGQPTAAVESDPPGNSHSSAGSAQPKAPERAVRRTHRDTHGAHTMRGVRALMPHLWPPATYINEDGSPLTFQALAARTTTPATRPAPHGAPTHRRQRSHATRWGRVSWHPPDTLR